MAIGDPGSDAAASRNTETMRVATLIHCSRASASWQRQSPGGQGQHAATESRATSTESSSPSLQHQSGESDSALLSVSELTRWLPMVLSVSASDCELPPAVLGACGCHAGVS